MSVVTEDSQKVTWSNKLSFFSYKSSLLSRRRKKTVSQFLAKIVVDVLTMASKTFRIAFTRSGVKKPGTLASASTTTFSMPLSISCNASADNKMKAIIYTFDISIASLMCKSEEYNNNEFSWTTEEAFPYL